MSYKQGVAGSSPAAPITFLAFTLWVGYHWGTIALFFRHHPPTQKSRKPRCFLDFRPMSRVGLEPTTYGLKAHEAAPPNCAKNCSDAHRRWPTQLTQKPSISDAGRRPPTPESGSQSRCATGLRHAP